MKKEKCYYKKEVLKKTYPNKFAVCAGHIDINEEPEMAAIRELEEETGITVKKEDLIKIDNEFLFSNKVLEN